MEGAIGSCLFESCGRGVHSLLGGSEGTGGQHLDLLGVADLGVCVDHLLPGFQEVLSELSELKDFSFDEQVPQSLNCVINELLVWLSMFEDVLTKGMERGLSAISRSSLQFDGEDGMSLSHGEESPGARIVQYELHIFGFALIVISVAYRHQDAEPSIRPILYKWGNRVSESRGVVDDILIHATYDNWG